MHRIIDKEQIKKKNKLKNNLKIRRRHVWNGRRRK